MSLDRVLSAPVIAVDQAKTERANGDKIQITSKGKEILIEVSSASGIGEATIRLAEGDWPESVVLRFHLGGLEGLTITNGKVALRDLSRLVFGEDGKPSDKRYLNTGGPYHGRGYHQVKVPKTLFDDGAKFFKIHWIDFYRR